MIAIIGGCGFIGSALVRELNRQGEYVVVYDNFRFGTKENLEGLNCDIIEGSILDYDQISNALTLIDEVYNLAASPYIPSGYLNYEDMIEINTLGTLNVMKACLENKVSKIVHYSTSEVYGSQQTVMDEFHPLNPQSSYAVSKLAGERLCYVLHKEQKLPVVILRQFNCFGERETHPYIIPEIISQLSKGNILKLGNVNAERDFTYVEDAVQAAILLMETKDTEGEVFNCGSGFSRSILRIAEEIGDLMNVDFTLEIDKEKFRPFEVDRLQCSNHKLIEWTRWMQPTSFREGLQKTIDWYKEHGRWCFEK